MEFSDTFRGCVRASLEIHLDALIEEDLSGTSLVSIRNNRLFRTALTAQTEPCTLSRGIICVWSKRR